MKKRIWELDAARGLCVLAMVLVHLIYDLSSLFALFDASQIPGFSFLARWGGVLFLLISGICVTLGSRPVRRGLIVLAAALLVTGVTFALELLGWAAKGFAIWFGVLHCLGFCMLLWKPVRKLPIWTLAVTAGVLIGLGFYLDTLSSPYAWLIPFGIKTPDFVTSDYFPLLPNFGFFLLGAVFGKTVYQNKTTLFPKIDPQMPLVRFFCFWGKWSLPVYLLHQPVLTGLVFLFYAIF